MNMRKMLKRLLKVYMAFIIAFCVTTPVLAASIDETITPNEVYIENSSDGLLMPEAYVGSLTRNWDDESSGNSFPLPEIVHPEEPATKSPNLVTVTATPSKDGIVVHVSNLGVDSLDSVTVTARITGYQTTSLTASVPPIIGRDFTWNAPMIYCNMSYDITVDVVDGSGTFVKTGHWEYNYTEEVLAAIGLGKGTFSTRAESVEYHFRTHRNDIGVSVNNIVDYLGKAVDCYNDTLVNPGNYNIIQQTPRPGYEAAHKYTHKTTGLFIIVADSSQDILSFGGRTP